jgi:site-specific DNA recombinase
MSQTEKSLTVPESAEATSSWSQPVKRAVLYLRVSTTSQVNTDYDPEGLSIPAQRSSCERKAAQMGVEVVDTYIEPGKSATSMDKREAFQQMLERIRTVGDVDYVIVYKLSRMNRNRIDDGQVLLLLRTHGVTLISATEQIDETPVGQLMHGILAAFNEFRSSEDGADISYKMAEKARRGGTLGRAAIGYMNVRVDYDGREIRTVAVDPDRAPLVRQAFELYATGNFTISQLAGEMETRGLTTRSGRHPSMPLSTSHLQRLLINRYYLGYVTFKGEEIPGRHEPIISPELFDEVQAVISVRGANHVRKRTHDHYLKGILWCYACHEGGREFRLIRQQSKGNGGTYEYFFCRGKQEHVCDMRHIWVDEVEDAVVDFYGRLRLPATFVELVRNELSSVVEDSERSARLRRSQITRELGQLAKKEDNLLDLAADGNLPSPKVRDRLRKIEGRRSMLKEECDRIEVGLEVGVALLVDAIALLQDGEELYRQCGDGQRQLINQALFKKLYVRDNEIAAAEFNEPFDELISARDSLSHSSGAQDDYRVTVQTCGNKSARLEAALVGGGSSKALMVEMMGLEPTTPCLQSRCSSQLSYIPVPRSTWRAVRPAVAAHTSTRGCPIGDNPA